MKLYFAGPLFSAAERAWNAEIAAGLRAAGHEVFLPQEQEPDRDPAGIFVTDVAGIDWAEALVAVMDGPDPDAGTAWECGYAYGKKPVVLVRTDIRARDSRSGPYNAMLMGSATDRLDLPGAAKPDVIRAVLHALANVEETRPPGTTGRFSMQTRSFPSGPDARSPAGAEIRYLIDGETGNMIHSTVPPGQVNRATVHATVSEFWHVLSGEGQIWRRDATGEETTILGRGVSIDIPVGTAFQYRCTGVDPLQFLCITMPRWPGDKEATVIEGPWKPTAPEG